MTVVEEVTRYVGVELHEEDDGRIVGHVDLADHLRGPDGAARPGTLLTMLDSAGGLCAGLAALPEGWVVSTNLAARFVAPARVGPIRMEAAVSRVGRNNVVATVAISDEGTGVLVADGVLTSAILVPEQGPPQWTRPLVLGRERAPEPQPMLTEWLQVRTVDGGVEMPLDEIYRNPWGIMHGGIVGMLVDLAAGGRTTDVVLHFLAPNRVGPVRATARPLGTRSDGTVQRVDVRDVGADRVTAVAIVSSS